MIQRMKQSLEANRNLENYEPQHKQQNSRKQEVSHSAKGKYASLYEYLVHQSGQRISLTFDQIERIIGVELPPSARNHRPWWANSRSHSQANAWLNAGWMVDSINEKNVIFIRNLGGWNGN